MKKLESILNLYWLRYLMIREVNDMLIDLATQQEHRTYLTSRTRLLLYVELQKLVGYVGLCISWLGLSHQAVLHILKDHLHGSDRGDFLLLHAGER